MSTLLHVERDRTYSLVRRRLRASCPRDQWFSIAGRREALARAIPLGIAAVQSDGPHEFVAPCPVTVVISPVGQQVVYADISLPGGPPELVYPDGRRLTFAPVVPSALRWRTTYAEWAEGPLPHVELMDDDEPDPLPDSIQRIRHQNAALRARIDAALEGQRGPVARNADPNLVDFRIRLIFKCPSPRILESRQGGGLALLADADVLDEATREADAPPIIH